MDFPKNLDDERLKLKRNAQDATKIYLIFVFAWLLSKALSSGGISFIYGMKANEVGDLFAGLAGPFALIWIVYGYFLQELAIRQQGEELRQNTQALHLQAESLNDQVIELRESVEQQKNLVNLTREQIESNKEAVAYEREREQRRNEPRFIFSVISKRSGSAGTFVNFSLWNAGNDASDILIMVSESVIDRSPVRIALLRRNDNQSLNLQLDERIGAGGLAWIRIICKDAGGSTYDKAFVFCRDKSGQFDHFLETSPAP